MNFLSWLLAWRYLMGTHDEKNISTMIKVCVIGILIGSFALALVMAVMEGFEQAIYEKMQGIHAQIIMRSNTADPLDYERISTVLKTEFPAVIAHSPSSLGQVIIQNKDENEIGSVLVLRGINPGAEEKTTSLAQKLAAPANLSLTSCVHDQSIIIGESVASQLDATIGSVITLLFVSDHGATGQRVNLDTVEATIGGIFKTGIDEIDQGVIFCSQDFFDHLFPESGISQINLRLDPSCDEQKIVEALKQRFDLDVYTWKDLYLPLVSALRLEKYAMFFILALIMLVACMNIISLLFMYITKKRSDIALFKSMGLSDRKIRHIFLIMALIIATAGASTGLVLAFIVGLFLQRYPFITLPDVYYVTNLPVALDVRIFVVIFVLIIGMSIIATLLPLRNIKKINLANVLRFES